MQFRPRPNPIGNMMNISGNGYNNQGQNGGYYNPYGNTNNNYYNPHLMYQQQRAMEAQRKEEERQQSDLWKKLSRNANKIHHLVDDIEEHVKRYDPVEINDDMQEEMRYNKLASLTSTQQTNYDQSGRIVSQVNTVIQQTKEVFSDDMDLVEYFEKAGELILEARIQDNRNKQRDVSKLYSGSGYKDLINYHSSGNNSYFNSVFRNNMGNKNINIEDMEVTLPPNIGNEYHTRRSQFMDAILNKR